MASRCGWEVVRMRENKLLFYFYLLCPFYSFTFLFQFCFFWVVKTFEWPKEVKGECWNVIDRTWTRTRLLNKQTFINVLSVRKQSWNLESLYVEKIYSFHQNKNADLKLTLKRTNQRLKRWNKSVYYEPTSHWCCCCWNPVFSGMHDPKPYFRL